MIFGRHTAFRLYLSCGRTVIFACTLLLAGLWWSFVSYFWEECDVRLYVICDRTVSFICTLLLAGQWCSFVCYLWQNYDVRLYVTSGRTVMFICTLLLAWLCCSFVRYLWQDCDFLWIIYHVLYFYNLAPLNWRWTPIISIRPILF